MKHFVVILKVTKNKLVIWVWVILFEEYGRESKAQLKHLSFTAAKNSGTSYLFSLGNAYI